MFRTISLVAVLLLSVARPASADDEADLRAISEAYIQHPVMQQIMDELLSEETMYSMAFAEIQGLEGALAEDELEPLFNIIAEEMARMRPKMEALMVTAAIQTFELDEIQALKDFLDTDAGSRAMLKSGAFTQAFYVNSGAMLQELYERIATRVETELLE